MEREKKISKNNTYPHEVGRGLSRLMPHERLQIKRQETDQRNSKSDSTKINKRLV